jgi:hypothetical protein
MNRAVAISMLTTAIARPSLPAAPMPAIDAPEAGTGKSLLVDVASILASGTEAPVMDYGQDAVEAGKRLDAMLLAGDPLIDNVEATRALRLRFAFSGSSRVEAKRLEKGVGDSHVAPTPFTRSDPLYAVVISYTQHTLRLLISNLYFGQLVSQGFGLQFLHWCTGHDFPSLSWQVSFLSLVVLH